MVDARPIHTNRFLIHSSADFIRIYQIRPVLNMTVTLPATQRAKGQGPQRRWDQTCPTGTQTMVMNSKF